MKTWQPSPMIRIHSVICATHLFQLNMVITSILILCLIAMALYQIIQALEHLYKKKCQ